MLKSLPNITFNSSLSESPAPNTDPSDWRPSQEVQALLNGASTWETIYQAQWQENSNLTEVLIPAFSAMESGYIQAIDRIRNTEYPLLAG